MKNVLEQHYVSNSPRFVKSISNRLRGDLHSAEDVVQEAYCRALQYLDSCKSEEEFPKWFSTILNRSFKDWKKDRRESPLTVEIKEEHLSTGKDFLEKYKICEEIAGDINNLKEPQKEVCTLYFLKGYTPIDIAKVMDINYNTLKKSISRFKNTMREQYADSNINV